MSITAFPVLARIVEERGLGGTYVGTTAIACAAVDDATAWCALAGVAALAKAGRVGGALLTTLLALLFAGAMLFLLKPRAERLSESWARGGLAGALTFLFASALATEVIGVHALFGAFLAGVVMPSRELRKHLRERLEPFSSELLLPLFFAFTGLRTQVGLLDDVRSWAVCGGVVAVAVAGKLGGSTLAGRWTGMSWQESLSVGALMNTRGLVELVVLNLGYDLGILSPKVFAMMVLMALTTTCMSGPLLSLAESWGRRGPLLPTDAGVAALASKKVRDGAIG
jgi:Kef-type K+ transport system membrane component KefB